MEINQFAESSRVIKHVYRITPDIYYSFQRVSDDFNPLHTDRDFALREGFPEIVMYGNILNAFVSHFVGMLLPIRSVIIQAQDIQFHNPCFLNDKIELEASVESVSESVQAIEYKLKFRRLEDDGKTKLIAKGHVQIGLL